MSSWPARGSLPSVRNSHWGQHSEDIGETIDRIERERNDLEQRRLEMLAATNLISHGVDLERIELHDSYRHAFALC